MRTEKPYSNWSELRKSQPFHHLSEGEGPQIRSQRIQKATPDRSPRLSLENSSLPKLNLQDSFHSAVSTRTGSGSMNKIPLSLKNEWIERKVRADFQRSELLSLASQSSRYFKHFSLERISETEIVHYQSLKVTIESLRRTVNSFTMV